MVLTLCCLSSLGDNGGNDGQLVNRRSGLMGFGVYWFYIEEPDSLNLLRVQTIIGRFTSRRHPFSDITEEARKYYFRFVWGTGVPEQSDKSGFSGVYLEDLGCVTNHVNPSGFVHVLSERRARYSNATLGFLHTMLLRHMNFLPIDTSVSNFDRRFIHWYEENR